ncbi:MAG: HigA family addiction module antidote protein [Acidimicrobiaceae bacterium]|nr:HigA family addiction module antidote protein [Acidimicrobiaceae bacterium]MYE96719.1 HigA family addiction module antidote protein [Acidimicrobiaceae bacterium]MYH43791.1 HigA family addiction module antidote protein [Acidimicrobiaceae bacterium]MYI55379.1 HigA family addiction module antidote protein [Acidimicrobiaceae bacterium]MYJ42167.1 HigA family addiction module antidote protein [Acidimicrobiaceae bacterium]
MVRVPTDREPTHRGSVLLHEFLQSMQLTQRELATAINVPYQRVNEVVRGRRGITASTALRLAKLLGTTRDVWMSLQLRGDLYCARRMGLDGCRRGSRLAGSPECVEGR